MLPQVESPVVANPWQLRGTSREALDYVSFYIVRLLLATDGVRIWSFHCFGLTWYNCACCKLCCT